MAICDNNRRFIRHLESYVRQYEGECGRNFMVYEFLDGENLFEFCCENPDIDIIFMDVVFAHSNGIDIAKRIRKLNQRVKIIFISSCEKYAVEGYGIDADGYLLKPPAYSEVKEQLNHAIGKIEKSYGKFYLDATDKGKVLLPYDDIVYIETYLKHTRIHTRNESFLSFTKMKEYDRRLKSHGFCRCHAAYIINLGYIRRIDSLTIILKDRTEIPISKSRKKELMEAFTDYVGTFQV